MKQRQDHTLPNVSILPLGSTDPTGSHALRHPIILDTASDTMFTTQYSVTLSATSSSCTGRQVPLLSLAPPALALGTALDLGEPGAEHTAGAIWNSDSPVYV